MMTELEGFARGQSHLGISVNFKPTFTSNKGSVICGCCCEKKEEEAEIQPGLKSNDSAGEEATEEGLNTSFDRRRRKEGGIRGEMRRSKYIFSIK